MLVRNGFSNRRLPLLLIAIVLGSLTSCDDVAPKLPKPQTYFRIDLDEKSYQLFDSLSYPYAFAYPSYALVHPHTPSSMENFWLDIEIPKYQGSINLSYKPVKDKAQLKEYINDCYTFITKHFQRSQGVLETEYTDDVSRVYSVIYDIKGKTVPSSCQFYITDSSKHFIRGALYFNCIPNNDSLQPVIDYIHKDIEYLIETLRWKN